ncbi:MAG: VIT1/CCC1 transporter family protein [Flavobacteriaceae bacterium]|nr:VIT1/CCC1 transporter family protein [Flavobacteriaceae bacterium]
MIEKKHIQTEVDAAFLYQKLAEKEEDPTIAKVFVEMSDIEKSHALAFLSANHMNEDQLPQPSSRARFTLLLGKIFGYELILGQLLDVEKNLANATLKNKSKLGLAADGQEKNHVTILENLIKTGNKVSPHQFSRFERRHKTMGGNALRAAVLGGNDGLLSNFSLVMGVAGATTGGNEVLLAGSAGLLAGALSMALGEWISVKSSQELSENQMEIEMNELIANPEGEKRELKLIYMTKGIDEMRAAEMAEETMKDINHAHQILVKEELGIMPDEIEGQAWQAAIYSFLMFAVGAIIPLIPFILSSGAKAIGASIILSGLGLFFIGSIITLFTGKSVWYSGFRQVLFGFAAAGITYGIGHFIGVSLAG